MRVTLIDFGCERGILSFLDDMENRPPPTNKRASGQARTSTAITRLKAKPRNDSSTVSRSRSSYMPSSNRSTPFSRKLSAVGSNRAHAVTTKDIETNKDVSGHSSDHGVDQTNALLDHVSYYGMMVDAYYSVGSSTINKYMMTDVPPNKDVKTVIAIQNHPLATMGHFLSRQMDKSKQVNEQIAPFLIPLWK
jgi:hypothetical protein